MQQVHLQLDIEDQIKWKWTADGQYTTQSAYRAQFIGSYNRHHTKLIWRARAENKCKLFAWILIQNKILTSDNLALRGWPHQNSCVLCNGPMETGMHLCLTCPFAQAVWSQVSLWEGLNTFQQALPTSFDSINDWWEAANKLVPKESRHPSMEWPYILCGMFGRNAIVGFLSRSTYRPSRWQVKQRRI